MKIAVYYPWVYLKGGAERTILELVRHSQHDWTIVTNHYEPYSTFPEFREMDVVELATVSVKRSLYEVAHAAFTLLIQKFDWKQFDAVMISNEGLGNLVTLRSGLPPTFCYCHTPLKIAYDPITRARFFAQRRGLMLKAGIRCFSAVDRLTWPQLDRIFCNSEETRRRILDNRLAPASRLELLHPGIDMSSIQPSYPEPGTRDPYILLPGRIMWTKNVELALAAFAKYKASRPESDPLRLVVAGMVDQKSKSYLKELREQAQELTHVEFVISPDDETMHDLYRQATAVLSTSYNEDWGLTIIEGMAFGKPVLAVDQGGPRESVLHNETGLLLAADVDSFADGIARLAENPDLARRFGKAGRTRALRYDSRRFVSRIDEYVEELVSRRALSVVQPRSRLLPL